MRPLLRRFRPSIALLIAAFVLGLVAIGDHHYKQWRIERVEVHEWDCRHDGVECGGPHWETLEAHWQKRQVAYEVGVTVLTLGAIGAAVRSVRRPVGA